MNVIDPSLQPWILHNQIAQQEIDSDAAIASRLQEQEYEKLSMTSLPSYHQQNSNNTSHSMNSLIVSSTNPVVDDVKHGLVEDSRAHNKADESNHRQAPVENFCLISKTRF